MSKTLTISITIDPNKMTSSSIDQLIECWRADVEHNNARVTMVSVTGPWLP